MEGKWDLYLLVRIFVVEYAHSVLLLYVWCVCLLSAHHLKGVCMEMS